jgi:hypothetical protein
MITIDMLGVRGSTLMPWWSKDVLLARIGGVLHLVAYSSLCEPLWPGGWRLVHASSVLAIVDDVTRVNCRGRVTDDASQLLGQPSDSSPSPITADLLATGLAVVAGFAGVDPSAAGLAVVAGFAGVDPSALKRAATLGDIAGTILTHVARDRVLGQYAHSNESTCPCGHRLGQHTAAVSGGRRECLEEGCACKRFRKVRIRRKVARKTGTGCADPSSPILLLLRIADAAGVLVTTSDRGGSTADAMCDLRAALDALEAHFNGS